MYLLLTEDTSENVSKGAVTLLSLGLVSALLATTVILSAFISVREDLVSIGHIVELLLSLIIALVLVWMVQQGQLAVSFFDISGLRVFLNIQNLVEVPILVC